MPTSVCQAGGASPDSTEGSGHGGRCAVFSFVLPVKTGKQGNRSSPAVTGGQGPLHTQTQSQNKGVKTAGPPGGRGGGARVSPSVHPQPQSPNAQTARRDLSSVPQPSAFQDKSAPVSAPQSPRGPDGLRHPHASAPCRPRRATLSDHREGGAGSRAALRGREGSDKAVTDEPRQRHARRRPWVSSPGQAGVGLLAKLSLSIASTKSVPPSKLGLPASPANVHVTAGDPAARNLGFQQRKGPLTQRPEGGAPVGSRLSFSLPRGLPCRNPTSQLSRAGPGPEAQAFPV